MVCCHKKANMCFFSRTIGLPLLLLGEKKEGFFWLQIRKTVPFYGTEEQKEQLLKVIRELRDEKGCLMPIMQKAQEIYGYLPIEVQKIISDELGVP